MRLSKIINKDAPKVTAPKPKREPEEQPSAPLPEPQIKSPQKAKKIEQPKPQPPKEESKVSLTDVKETESPSAPSEEQSKAPEVDMAKLEEKIRGELEAKLLDLAKQKDKEVAEASEHYQNREKELQNRVKKLVDLVEGYKEQLDKASSQSQSEPEAKLEEEKKKLEEEFQQKQSDVKKTIDVLKQSLEEKEKIIQQKEKTIEQEKEERVKEQKQVEEKIEAAQETAVADIAMSASQERQNKYQRLKAQQVTQTQMHVAYENLIKLGQPLMEQVNQGNHPDLKEFKGQVQEVVLLAQKYEGVLIGVALQPYLEQDYFAYHATNCMILAVSLGMDLRITGERLMELATATFFHDIALMSIREDLDYPKEVSGQIKKEILEHPTKSAEMMRGLLSEEGLAGISQHHEMCDGHGYPEKLKQKDISLFAKIINVVDSFEAMTHARPYRPSPLPISEAMKQMIEIGKHSYDRQVLKSMMGQVGFYPVMTLVELSNKQIARVVRQNKKHPLSPVVKVEFDEWGHKLRKNVILDLTESKLIHVTGTLEEVESYQAREVVKREERQSLFAAFISRIIPMVVVLALLALLGYIVLKI